MDSGKAFLQDVGLADLQFPMRVASRREPAGQATVATIAVNARILAEFEASWIDRFMQVLHGHRDHIGTATLRANIGDYVRALDAKSVRIRFDYPYFVEKTTPVAQERCLVQHACSYTASAGAAGEGVAFRVEVPVVTTYPGSGTDTPGGLFGQRSVVTVETRSRAEVLPEDLVDLVDGLALSPMYSYLTREDREAVIARIHAERRTSVELVEEVRAALARRDDLDAFSVRCVNFGMLHLHSTLVGTEKSRWIPGSGLEDEEI